MINRLALLGGEDAAPGGAWGGGWNDDQQSAPAPTTGGVSKSENQAGETFDDLGVSDIDEIREDVNEIKANYQKILEIEVSYVKEVNQEAMSGAMRKVDTLVQQSVDKSKKVREKLTVLKSKNVQFESQQAANSTKAMWRNNQLRSLTRAVSEATGNVQSAADHFFTVVAKRAVRNYCIVAEVDDNQKAQIEMRAESDPYGMQAEISQKLESFGVSDATLDKIEELEHQNREIRAIGEAVKSLNQMFEQMATMVYEQGEKLDEIATNVAQTRDHVAAAKVEIIQAESLQKGVRKRKLCIALLCIVILVILIVVLLM